MASLWDKALKGLSIEDQKTFNVQRSDKRQVLEEIVKAVTDQSDRCLQSRWTVQGRHGRKIVIRDVCTKMASGIKKFVEVVDVAVNYDPVHSALPWAGIRVFLQLVVNDTTTFAEMIEGLEMVSSVIARHCIMEMLYLPATTEAQKQLEAGLIQLYAVVMRYLCKARVYYEGSTARRIVTSTFRPADLGTILDEITDKELRVRGQADLVDAERQQNMSIVTTNMEVKLGKAISTLSNLSVSQESLERKIESYNAPFIRIVSQVHALNDSLNMLERTEILKWLSKVPYREHHNSSVSGLLQSTGEWLLSHDKYLDWKRSSTSEVLWLHGGLGCGKTKLVTAVIEELRNEREATQYAAPVAYFYCSRNTAEHERTDACEILRGIIKQLSVPEIDGPILQPTASRYGQKRKETLEDGLRPSALIVSECRELISELIAVTPSTIIIDALDECDTSQRHILLSAILEITSAAQNVVKVLVTSRDETDIITRLTSCANISITANDNSQDIDAFVRNRVEDAISGKRMLYRNISPELKDFIVMTVSNGAEGMFRWADLQIDHLSDTERFKTETDLRTSLGRLPASLASSYEVIYNRILGIERVGQSAAIATLQWLLCAQKTMPANGFIAAVSSMLGDGHPLLSASDVLDYCCNLVVLDTGLDVFRLAHLSVREYLESRPENDSAKLHTILAEACLGALVSGKAPQGDFASYASVYWGAHSEKGEGKRERSPTLTKFLFDDEYFEDWLDIMQPELPKLEWNSNLARKLRGTRCSPALPASPLFAISCFGLVDILQCHGIAAKISDWNEFNADDTSALYLASRWGHAELVKFLIDQGADLNAKGGQFGSALQAAAFAGHRGIVQMLLANGAVATGQGEFPDSLHAAIASGNESLARFILEEGFEFADQAQFDACFNITAYGVHADLMNLMLEKFAGRFAPMESRDSLQDALYHRKERRAICILDTHGDVNQQTGYFGNALQAAICGGKLSLVKLLADRGADLEARGRFGHPLRAAAGAGHIEIVHWLVTEKIANVNAEDRKLGDCLQAAASKGHLKIMSLLIDRHARIDGFGGYYRNPLQAASFAGHDQAVRILLKHNAKLDVHGHFRDALQAAVHGAQETVVGLLLDEGCNIGYAFDRRLGGSMACMSPWGPSAEKHEMSKRMVYEAQGVRTLKRSMLPDIKLGSSKIDCIGDVGPVESAARWGNVSLMQLLLDRGASLNSSNPWSPFTALQIAAFWGHKEAVAFILDRGGAVNATRKLFGTALKASLEQHHFNIAVLLLQRGADVRQLDSCLQIYCGRGDLSVVKFLCENGADPGRGMHYASGLGQLEIVQFLLDHGAKVDALDAYHANALQLASANGHRDVVQLLLDSGADVNARGDIASSVLRAAIHARRGLNSVAPRAAMQPAMQPAVQPAMQSAMQPAFNAAIHAAIHARRLGSPIHQASFNGHLEVVRTLLDAGADIHRETTITHPHMFQGFLSKASANALFAACIAGHLCVARLLFEHDPQQYIRKRTLANAVEGAVAFDEPEVAIRMLEIGFSAGLKGEDCNEALCRACERPDVPNNDRLIRLLIDAGADISALRDDAVQWKMEIFKHGDVSLLDYMEHHGLQVVPKQGTETYAKAVAEAAAENQLDMIRYLLGPQPTVDEYVRTYGKALSTAVAKGYQDIVEVLVEICPSPNVLQSLGTDLLLIACSHELDTMLSFFLDRLEPLHDTAFKSATEQAAESKRVGTMRILFLYAVEQAHLTELARSHIDALLHLAITSNNNEDGNMWNKRDTYEIEPAVSFLLQKGANPNSRNSDGETALYRVVASVGSLRDAPGTIETLLRHGADVDTEGGHLGTALHAAVMDPRNAQIVRLLLDAGADVDCPKGFYGTPLQTALYSRNYTPFDEGGGNKGMVSVLLDRGADVNMQAALLGSALQIAAYAGKQAAVELLLQRGASVNARSGHYGTALRAARAGIVEWCRSGIEKILLNAGAIELEPETDEATVVGTKYSEEVLR